MFNIAANGAGGYNLTNSLRFRSSASAYLARTVGSSSSNPRSWTLSFWVKRGALGTAQTIISCGVNTPVPGETIVYFDTDDKFYFTWNGNNTAPSGDRFQTSMVFRDPSAWYHIVLSVDMANATRANRAILYVNGVVQTFTGIGAGGNSATTNWLQSGQTETISKYSWASSGYLDGYLTEMNLVDGQTLTPSSFGSTNSTTGVWQPAKYTGTYGTNGFYLNFSNIALTSGSNTGLGKDYSGNGNYWNTNNISVTAGTTYDAMTDSPTLTSATVANYCVMNPLQNNQTLTGANLDVSSTSVAYSKTFSTINVSSGKWYCEFTNLQALANLRCVMGISSNPNASLATGNYMGSQSYEWVFSLHDPAIANGGTVTTYGSTLTTNDILMMALDMDNGKVYWGKNGTWFGSSNPATSTNPAFTGLSGEMSIGVGRATVTAGYNVNGSMNFGQRAFSYTPPTGYVALNTYNLPTPTIKAGNKYMDATLYTGTNATLNITNAGAFKPDLVWLKIRDIAGNHQIVDSVRGVTKVIDSNTTGAEQTATAGTGLTAFNSNGFTLGTDTTTDGYTNRNGSTFVGWQWQAGQGSSSSNTNGTITSTVSVNASAGFSIVTYTGTGANATVGHGLGVAPKLIITLCRGAAGRNHLTYHASLGNTQCVLLDATNAALTSSGYWNSTSPTSSVFSLGTSGDANGSGVTFVAYCWAEIAGFSKFGSYVGNGSADGPFVYLGFRPKYVLVKSSSNVGSWVVHDSSRSTYNVVGETLYPNLSNAEVASDDPMDFLSNGFKLRTAGSDNTSGYTIIYAAFAENPFKNALAR